MSTLLTWLKSEEHVLTLAVFRVLTGLIMFVSFFTDFRSESVTLFFSNRFNHFPYCGFQFVQPLSIGGTKLLLFLISIGFLLLAVGYLYRYVTWFLLVAVSYFYLIDSAYYNNHYYFIALLLAFFSITNANGLLSVDAYLNNRFRTTSVPKWQRFLFVFQTSIVYFYGGLAKLHADWVTGKITKADLLSMYGEHMSLDTIEMLTPIISWGGLIFDLTIPFLLIWKRTRFIALVPVLIFHVSNELRFDIGIFPYLMLASTLLYFPSNDLAKWLRFRKSLTSDYSVERIKPIWINHIQVFILAAFVIFQLVYPLRHYFDGRDVLWSKIGYRLSWHMKMSASKTEQHFYIKEPSTGNIIHEIDYRDYLSPRQRHALHVYPANTIRYVEMLEKDMKELGMTNMKLSADFKVGLNGRELRPWIDPSINLLEFKDSKCRISKDWILKKPFD